MDDESLVQSMASPTPPGGNAGEMGYVCMDCGGAHSTCNVMTVILAHLIRIQAMPFACDQELHHQVVNAETVQELTGAYRHLLVERAAVPNWFVETMTLDLMVAAWGQIVNNLINPLTGEFFGLQGDMGDYDAWDPDILYWEEAPGKNWHSPATVWGSGPVSTIHYPLQLFYIHDAAGETWRMDVGSVGGSPSKYDEDLLCKIPSLVGNPIQGALDSRYPIPMVTRAVVDRLEASGFEWELAWKRR